MKRGWSVKPLVAQRKVEGQLDSITKARNETGQRMALKANPRSMERPQRIHIGKPKSQPEDLERHLVH
jgi:hypothetical protein